MQGPLRLEISRYCFCVLAKPAFLANELAAQKLFESIGKLAFWSFSEAQDGRLSVVVVQPGNYKIDVG